LFLYNVVATFKKKKIPIRELDPNSGPAESSGLPLRIHKTALRHVRHCSFLSLVKINIVMLEQLGDVDLFVLRQSNLVASQGLTLLLARGNQLILRGGTTREVEIIKYVCKPMK
jgi:hypothetical protein